MWKEDKRVKIGMIGMIASMILLITTAVNELHIFIISSSLCLMIFFMGYSSKGIKRGVKLTLLMILFILISSLSNYLVFLGYISEDTRKALLLVVVVSLFMWMLISYRIKTKGKSTIERYLQFSSKIKENEFTLDGSFVILVKRNVTSVDMVYKIFKKNDFLYFCRVGGQFQEINEVVLDLTSDKVDAKLLSDKYNFKIPCNDIESITTINRGSFIIVRVEFIVNSKKVKYVLHPVIEFDYMMNFFSRLGILLIEK